MPTSFQLMMVLRQAVDTAVSLHAAQGRTLFCSETPGCRLCILGSPCCDVPVDIWSSWVSCDCAEL